MESEGITAGPLMFAAGVLVATFVVARLLRWMLAFLVNVYVLIGVGSYLYWAFVEAGPPHGSYEPSFATLGDIAWHGSIAAAAILAWPVWPVVRAFMLGGE